MSFVSLTSFLFLKLINQVIWFDTTQSKRFFDILTKYSIQTPIYLSGDRHIAEVSSQEIKPNYWIYDITSSGLTHSYDSLEEEPNQYRISPLLTMLNFGKIEINWKISELQAQIINVEGISQFTQKIPFQ